MSEPIKPPGDDFERDLAALSHAYRSAGREGPPPAIDAAIRAAARRAVHAGPQVKRRSWVSQWAAPAATAAVLVLTVSVSLISLERRPDLATSDVRHDVPALPKAPPAAAVPAPMQAPATAPVPEAPAQQALPAPTPPAALEKAKPNRDAAPPTAKLRAQEAAPMREEKRREPDAQVQEGFSAPPPALPAKTTMPAPAAAPMARDSAEAPQRNLATPAPQAPAAAAAGASASGMVGQRAKKESTDSAARAPEAWLKDIVELHREGKTREALEELEKFRKRFPDYVLPPELKDLR